MSERETKRGGERESERERDRITTTGPVERNKQIYLHFRGKNTSKHQSIRLIDHIYQKKYFCTVSSMIGFLYQFCTFCFYQRTDKRDSTNNSRLALVRYFYSGRRMGEERPLSILYFFRCRYTLKIVRFLLSV